MLRAETRPVGADLTAQTHAPRRPRAAIAFAAVTVLFGPMAYVSMFNGFHAYDDEGFFLVTIRDFLSGHPLLTPYVPLYGPFFYEVMGGLFKLLGLQPTHDVGRWVTLAIWLTSSIAGGSVVLKLTRSVWLGLAGQFVTFMLLGSLAAEPLSTYGPSSLLLLLLIGAAAWRSTRPRATAVVIGGIVGALWLTKVNVGAFAALAVVFAWAIGTKPSQKRWVLSVMAVAIAVLPLVLTSSLRSKDWVLEFAILVALSAAAIALACVASPPRQLQAPSARFLAAGGFLVVFPCLAIALAGGTRLVDVWNALFVFPIRFPGVFTWPLQINLLFDLWAVLSLAAALVVFVLRRNQAVTPAVAGYVRVAAGLITWLSILLLPIPTFLIALPLAWLATQAPNGDVDNPVDPYCRVLLPTLAVLESLQAYPVAGTQLSMSAVGLIPVGALLLNDGIRQLRLASPWSANWIAPSTLLVNVIALYLLTFLAVAGYGDAAPLGLPGAESVRVPAQQGQQLRALVTAMDGSRCSHLITFPGMDSFYVWTTQESQSQIRYGQWWLTVDRAEQGSMVQRLQGQPGVCVVKNEKLIDFWTSSRPAPSGPLVDFINGNFVDAGTYGDYELLVRASP